MRAGAVTDGLVIVDKPPGMTSHDVVGQCRRIFGQRRVGHGGTLDPDATGLLLVALGRATRLLRFVSGLPKSYQAEIVLGEATSTLDSAGDVTGVWDMVATSLADAQRAAVTLTGAIDQIPPMVSAIKIDGRRLHELARQGIEVERPPRRVTVFRFDLAEVGAGAHGPVLSASVDCSSGTYVRSLAADLGAALGGGAHLRRLRRSGVGPWTLADAVALGSVSADSVLPPAAAVRHLTQITVAAPLVADVAHGRVLDAGTLGGDGRGPWAVLDDAGDLLAVYEQHGPGAVKPSVVVVSQDR